MSSEINLIPFFIDEICNGTNYNDEYTKISNHKINSLITYGVVKHGNNENDPNSIIITDENYKYDVLVTADLNDKQSMRVIQSLNVDDLVWVRGKLKWVNHGQTNKVEIITETIAPMSIIQRTQFFGDIILLRQNEVFKKETSSCLYNFLIRNKVVTLKDIKKHGFIVRKKSDRKIIHDLISNFPNPILNRVRYPAVSHSLDKRIHVFRSSNGELRAEIRGSDENLD